VSDKKRNEIVAVIKMMDAHVYHFLEPLSMASNVSMVHIVRPKPPGSVSETAKSKYHEIKGKNRFLQLIPITLSAIRLGRRPEVKAFVSFFAFPYGLIALFAGWLTGKPVHIGFVGSDWYKYCRSWYGGMLNIFLRKSELITVTGEAMKQELIRNNYMPRKIYLLPHAVSSASFANTPPDQRAFDCIFVGNLIRRKRVDLIIEAIDRIKKNHHEDIKLCIVGDGPLRSALEADVISRGLDKQVFFVGYQPELTSFFSNARINVMASDMEGLPFSIVEGVAAVAIPVSTNVGTIAEFIEHGKNGLLVPPGDAEALASAIFELITNKKSYHRMRESVLNLREEYRFEKVSGLWASWVEGLIGPSSMGV
jgi:glycosyltransferase involved in cell wall biosynthesis